MVRKRVEEQEARGGGRRGCWVLVLLVVVLHVCVLLRGWLFPLTSRRVPAPGCI
jgi:hypothetical protein